MNYLAHAYLSFNDLEILLGNMISDFVKGKAKFSYSAGIQKGIALHRAIDEFTDTHPATKKAKEFFRPVYRLYSGAFMDVVYDHFLANDTNQFTDADQLKSFTGNVYQILQKNIFQLPQQFQNIFPFMQKHDWLYNYRFLPGIEKSFGGLVHRAKYISESASAFKIFNENYLELDSCYKLFFPELKNFALQYISGSHFN